MESATVLRPKTVGEALVVLRHRARISRDGLAKRAGVATGTLSRYENDATRRPDVRALRRIGNALAELTDADPRLVWDEVGQLLDSQARIDYLEAQAEALTDGDDDGVGRSAQ